LAQLDVAHFVELATLVVDNKIGSRVAKDLLPELFGATQGPLQIAEQKNLLQVSDSSALQPVIDSIIADNPEVVQQYRDGKEASIQFLVGQGMKLTKGAANPALLKEMIAKSIN